MSKDTKKQVETVEFGPTSAVPDWSRLFDSNGARALAQSSEALWSGMAAISQELAQFATARLRDGMAVSSSMLKCGSDARAAFELECDYARDVTRQYIEESGKLLNLAADMTSRSLAPFEALTREALERLERR